MTSRRNLFVILAVTCALVAALVAASVVHDRQRRLDEARDRAATVARLLEEQTANMVSAADLALLGIVENLRRDPVPEAHDSVFENSLRRLLEKIPAVRALFVVGPDGFLVQDSDRDTPRRNLADRDYFRAHLEDPEAGLFIGQPLVSRSVGTWFLGVSRRIEDSDGGFAGVAAAAVDVAYFENLYEQLGLREGDIITLATTEGVLVARRPRADAERVGRRLVPGGGESRLERALAEAPAGTFEAVSTLDGTARLFAYHAFPGQPLVALVGLSRERILAAWRLSALAAAAATAAALAISALLLWMMLRYTRREAAAQAMAAESAKFEALGRLTSGVAHDFNNLLAVFNAALRLLGRRPADEARTAELVEQGLGAVERGRGLVAQLMDVARRQEASAEGIDLNAALAGLATLLETSSGPKARIELDLAPDVGRCRLDLSRLDAAILNLVTNACDAMPEDVPDSGPNAGPNAGTNAAPGDRAARGTIRISTANCPAPARLSPERRPAGSAAAYVRVTVRDDGAGMPPEIRRRAAEPLFSTKGERGTGLGLSRVHEFVTEAGGGMEIESAPGAGTAVHLYFPRA